MRWPSFLDQLSWTSQQRPATGGSLDVDAASEVLFDEELLSRLRRLVLLSRTAVSQGIAGEHKSRRKGSSPEFADFKSYAQGDDFRRIDWNIYGRLDSLFIRLSDVTTELTVHLLVDASKSMDWRGSADHPSKFSYARRLAGSFAYVSLWHFDRVIITPFSDGLRTSYGPVQGRANIQPALQYLTNLEASGTTDLLDAVQRYTSSRHRPGVLILISDLLSGEPDSLQAAIRYARNRGWQISVIHIVDEFELAPESIARPFGDGSSVTLELIDLEGGERLRLSANEALLDRYRSALERWKSSVEQICLDEHVDYILLRTDWSFEQIVLRRLHEAGLVA